MNKISLNIGFLEELFGHVLYISRGECLITDDIINQYAEEESKMNLLIGLKILHEDLELYKSNFRSQVEAEYELKMLRTKNQELEQFNYMASHDLKEPLRTMNCYSSLLLKKYEGLLDESGIKYLTFVKNSSTRMQKLVESLLNHSIISNESTFENVDCNALIVSILDDLKLLTDEANAEVTVDKLPIIYASSLSMNILFHNLISNAIKYRSKDRTCKVRITCTENNDQYTICIKDNGLGIKDEDMEKVFELFGRLHSKKEIEGTGIGLSTCKKIVGLHKGKIWLESVFGEGTSIFFSLPNLALPESSSDERGASAAS